MNTRALLVVGTLLGLAIGGCDSDTPTTSGTTDASVTADATGSAGAAAAEYCRLEACVRPECPVPSGAAWPQCNVDLTLRANECRVATPSATDAQNCACGFLRMAQSCQDLLHARAMCLASHCP